MFQKIKNHNLYSLLNQLQDIRIAGLVIFGIIALLITWSGIGAIDTNYNLQKQIAQLQQQIKLQTLQDKNLQLQTQYYNTDEYLELQARVLFDKGLPGEKLMIVPQNVALAQIAKIPTSIVKSAPAPQEPSYQRNFEAWINFFFHRDS